MGFKLFMISYRNLWRNKRRTIITVSSIFFGVILTALMGSMQEGSYQKMVENIVNYYSGYIQVFDCQYWEDKTIDNSFELTSKIENKLNDYPEIQGAVPRLESFALASSGELTKGVMVAGINPQKEQQFFKLNERIVFGDFFKKSKNGALIGVELAERLQLSEEDSIVLFGQGYHGITAAGKYKVIGLFKHANPLFNRQLVYLDLKSAQDLYGAENHLTSLVLMLDNNNKMLKVLPDLKLTMDSIYEVKSWEEMYPNVLQQIESDRSSALVMKAILYMVIMFGILGTVMMMISERKREFGVMMAIGMTKGKIALMIVIEVFFIALFGVITGLIGSMPVVGFFVHHPIPLTGNGAEWMSDLGFEPYMFFAWDMSVFLYQALAVLGITLLILIVPLFRILRLTEMKALKI